jgi:hypothetical protein
MSTSPGTISDGLSSVSDAACVVESTLVPSSPGNDGGTTGAVPKEVATRVSPGFDATMRNLISAPSSAGPRT